MSIRILIVDDHGVLRAGLRALLNAESNLEVVGDASNGKEALAKAQDLRPDLVLMDISMPEMNGLESTQQMLTMLPSTRILLLTVHEEGSLLREAIELGASGYILKRAVESELMNAIQVVMRGELYIHPAMNRALLQEFSDSVPNPNSSMTLTHREVEVLKMLALGYTNRQIADALNISVRTVESHRSNLIEKLGLHSRVDLVRFAVQRHLIHTNDLNLKGKISD